MKKTFEIKAELPLKYHALFAIVATREGKTVNDILEEILTSDPRIKKLKEYFDSLPPMPDDLGIRPRDWEKYKK